jgi:acyl-CoA synthetase (NDP forming)
MRNLERLLRPKTIAVIGGGPWCANVIRACARTGFAGEICAVHPTRTDLAGCPAVASVADLPWTPDAAYIGVNREATIGIVRDLATLGAGGAVCFASGFREAQAETGDGDSLQTALVEAAGDLPILGPNCYGFLNLLDGAALWPDQHGAERTDRGVALLMQSSNIALNMTMQRRGLPLAYVMTAGNQAQTGLSTIGTALLEDPRVTALGLHIEGIDDLRAFEAMAATARHLRKPIVALKVGTSDQACAATVSHTASLAGSAAGSRALLRRLGIGQVESLPELLETLKLLHVTGPLPSTRIAFLSCSGGEASLVADTAVGTGVTFPPLTQTQRDALRAALGPKVALANPLDYHTYIWADTEAMTRCFSAMMTEDLALGLVVLDFPRADRCDGQDWDKVIEAVARTKAERGVPMAIVSSLPETLPEETATALVARGIAPMSGFGETLKAIAIAAEMTNCPADPAPLLLPGLDGPARTLTEAEAKSALAAHGVTVPKGGCAESAAAAAHLAQALGYPVALKGEGLAHKTEAGALALGLSDAPSVAAAAHRIGGPGFLVERMVTGGVAELLVGVVSDPAHGFVLTLGAGGTLTELMADTVSLLLPVTEDEILRTLDTLRCAKLLDGYRGTAPASRAAICKTILAVQDYVTATAKEVLEVEINPLIATPTQAVAADALIRLRETP